MRHAYPDPPTGSTAVANLGAATGWKVLSSATATQFGAQISTPGFSISGWLSVTNDGGGAPGTEISALLQNGTCPSVFYSTNMKSCFGQMTKVGPDTIAQFSVPWWYRTEFFAPASGQDAKLIVNGVVGAADVWVNGTEVASSAAATGDYARNVFDISGLLRSGTNSLAIELHQAHRLRLRHPLQPRHRDHRPLRRLRRNGAIVDRNVYWESTTPDVVNWSKTLGNPQATMTQYANLKALQNLPQATLSVTATSAAKPGPAGSDRQVTVTITNASSRPTVAFFLRADVRRGTASGGELSGDNELQSSIWSDNDVTLWPGESETLTASYRSVDLNGAVPVISVSGWNVPKLDIAAS